MPTHDRQTDNREEILLEHVKNLLRNSVSAKFAVGYYFFTCGLAALMNEVQNLKEFEQLAETHMKKESEIV